MRLGRRIGLEGLPEPAAAPSRGRSDLHRFGEAAEGKPHSPLPSGGFKPTRLRDLCVEALLRDSKIYTTFPPKIYCVTSQPPPDVPYAC
jgi:hypothetical protein